MALAVAHLAFFATGFANRQVYQRYFEPTEFVFLFLWLVLLPPHRAAGAGLRPRPLCILDAGQLGLTLVTAHDRTYGLS